MVKLLFTGVLGCMTMASVWAHPAALRLHAPLTPSPPVARPLASGDMDARPDRELVTRAAAQAQVDAPSVQAAAAAASQPPTIQDIIRGAFQPLGDSSVDWAERIAFCESTFNPNAVNSYSGAMGLFQFLPSTWQGTPFASGSPFDAQTNAQAAAWLLQKYGPSQWECQA